jgi:hypothetical protein
MIKRLLTIGICSILSLSLVAQTKSEVKKMPTASNPLKPETQQIYYTISFTSELADSALYKRSVHWYKTYNKSMRIQNEDCIPNQKITGRAECDLLGLKDGKEQAADGRLKFTVNTEIKNGKVTVEIIRFNIQDAKFHPVEPWLKLQEEDMRYKYYFIFIEEYSKKLLDSFVESVNVAKAK